MVTVSDLQLDVLWGRIVVSELIIHNQDCTSWEWSSPCLARIGRIEATLNFCSVLELPYYGPIFNHSYKDIYTVLIEDVQVFVEKRRNIFNFHLLDGDLDIPDVEIVMAEYYRRNMGQGANAAAAAAAAAVNGGTEGDDTDSFLTLSQCPTDESLQTTPQEKEEASVIVEKLVGAVSNLGRAATDGGSKALHSAIKNQKDSLVQSMKKMHSSVDTAMTTHKSQEGVIKKKDKVAEGVSVIRQLGKVMEQNVNDIQAQMTFLQKPPKRKEGLPKKKMDMVRIGSMLLREMRIFTKDVLVQKHPVGSAATATAGGTSQSFVPNAPTEPNNIESTITTNQWSRPIIIWELAITGAEFSPSMSLRDPTTGLPVIGIPVDQCGDIILKRLMTEAAKSNTGRLLETAFGDVFSFMNVGNGGSKG